MIYHNANRPGLLEEGDWVVFRVPKSLIISNPSSVYIQDAMDISASSQYRFLNYGVHRLVLGNHLEQDTDYNDYISYYYTVMVDPYLWCPPSQGLEHDIILRLVSRDKYEFCSRYYSRNATHFGGIFPEAPSMVELTSLVNGIFEILVPEKCPKCGSSDIKASKHLAGVNTHEGCCDYIKNTILRDL